MSPSVPELYFAKALAVTGSLQIHHHLSRDPLYLPRFVTAVFPEFEVTFWLFLLQLSTTDFQLVQRVEILKYVRCGSFNGTQDLCPLL